MNRIINAVTMLCAVAFAAVVVSDNHLAAAGWFVVSLKCLQLEVSVWQ